MLTNKSMTSCVEKGEARFRYAIRQAAWNVRSRSLDGMLNLNSPENEELSLRVGGGRTFLLTGAGWGAVS